MDNAVLLNYNNEHNTRNKQKIEYYFINEENFLLIEVNYFNLEYEKILLQKK